MIDKELTFQQWEKIDIDTIDFKHTEEELESRLIEQLSELSLLEKDRENIGNPETLGTTVLSIVWEQFINQIGVVAGEDFIRENRGLTLDLRDSAHIQTTENFTKKKFATHNDKIDYQQRYNDWQSNFQRDEKGEIVNHKTRSGKEEATLVSGARKPFDQGRPVGSVEHRTDMDHTISGAEIIRDPAANAHMDKKEQIAFANSDKNLNEMNAGHNRSKGDKTMTEWLDNPNRKGQKPKEIFDITEEQDRAYREKDAAAREEYEKCKNKGEQHSIETGKQSQKEEFFRIGGAALRAVIMGLLAELIKKIVTKLVAWFRSGNRVLKTFIESIKNAIKAFVDDLKKHLKNAGNTLLTTIATAIIGPIVGVIKKAWVFLKQGYSSVKEAIQFLRDPQNANMPFSIKLLNVGKIVVVGLTAGGSLLLGETIEKSLTAIPIFAVQIPGIGSLANMLGLFLSSVACGVVGAFALNKIDEIISEKLIKYNTLLVSDKRSEIIESQNQLNKVSLESLKKTILDTVNTIDSHHDMAMQKLMELNGKLNSY